MEIPQLHEGQFLVYMTDIETGIVLNSDKTRYLSEGDNHYKIFDSLDEAKQYSKLLVEKDSSIECTIYDHEGKYIESLNLSIALKAKNSFDTILNKLGEEKIDNRSGLNFSVKNLLS